MSVIDKEFIVMRSKNLDLMEQILKFIDNSYSINGRSPTIREIADGLQISKSCVGDYLNEMERKKDETATSNINDSEFYVIVPIVSDSIDCMAVPRKRNVLLVVLGIRGALGYSFPNSSSLSKYSEILFMYISFILFHILTLIYEIEIIFRSHFCSSLKILIILILRAGSNQR